MRSRGGFLAYVKAAFTWHWNLLAVGAGAILAVLSRRADVVLPLLGAVELLYLGLLTTRPRFQKAVDARRSGLELSPQPDPRVIEKIQDQLKPEDWARFEDLRQRCLSLSRIAEQIRGPQGGDTTRVQEMQKESLERLLWMFLKLVYSQDALKRFLQATSRNQLEIQIAAAEKEFKEATTNKRSDKLLRSFEDKLETLKQRLANYERAEENRQLLAAEIDRIEQKVNAISELSVSSRDPADVSAQVDGIAEGVSVTEEAIRKLDVPPLFEMETAPRFLTQSE
jgi:hypothetical protein